MKKEISLNPMFVIEGYGNAQKKIKSFEERKVFLESEHGDLIELKLVDVLVGEKKLMQAIFKPAISLKKNTIYYLSYDNQTKEEKKFELVRWTYSPTNRERVQWRTSNLSKNKPLSKNINFIYSRNTFSDYDHTESANAIFLIKNKSSSIYWVKTEVVSTITNVSTVYYLYLNETDEKLSVGHNICSGAFNYSIEGRYKVRFTPMNLDGDSIGTTEWYSYDNPKSRKD
ncbi:hypothetical protein [Nonlabens ulvanivorans]|uniref:hypothetical protein n=1 Tax=Nonlabens ulvanivorans TaxID=906888 RepID=UPI0029438103|nr:hypothetical protein [Nonlabens ulvanivorans]WOI22292.1 hypothetical protein R1T42_11515 [Nonlabens ulvanivorans]